MAALKIVAAGDFHFGNPRIRPDELYEKIKKYFYPEVLKSHLVLLTGDTYDQLTTVNSQANKYVAMFIKDLFTMSAKFGIQVRILHGTYTHDRDQVSVCNSLMIPGTRAKIIDEIFAEEITDFKNEEGDVPGKLRILYIPDNLPYKKSEDVITHIRKVYSVVGWQKSDLVLGHGTFSHALPCDIEHGPACMYTIEQFSDIVEDNAPIIMGHIHTPSRKNNVYYCGSFDRMSHGEEEPKGFFTFSKENGIWNAKFIRDEDATLFTTVTVQEDTPDKAVDYFIKFVSENFPNKSGHVRVVNPLPEIRTLLHKICAQEFPSIIYTSKSNADKDKVSIKIADVSLDVFEDVKPNVHNLGDLVYQYLLEKDLLGPMTKEEVVESVHVLITG